MSEEEKKDDAAPAADAPAAPVEEKTAETAAAPATDAPADDSSQKSTDEAGAGAEVEVPAKFKKLVEEVENMSVLELNELVKVLEKKFGVSAAAVAVAGPAAGGDAGGEEKDTFNVELKSAGEQKIQVIKAVKNMLGLGLKEAKDMVEGAPAMLKEGVKKEEAEEMKKAIEEAGGSVDLK